MLLEKRAPCLKDRKAFINQSVSFPSVFQALRELMRSWTIATGPPPALEPGCSRSVVRSHSSPRKPRHMISGNEPFDVPAQMLERRNYTQNVAARSCELSVRTCRQRAGRRTDNDFPFHCVSVVRTRV